MFHAVCEAQGIQRRVRLCLPPEDLPTEWARVAGSCHRDISKLSWENRRQNI